MEKQYDDEEIEIDLRAILLEWRKRWWMIAAALVAGALAAGLFSRVILSPVYESTSMMYVLSKETTLSSLADLQMGTQLTQDYKVLVTSRPVLEEVISSTMVFAITGSELLTVIVRIRVSDGLLMDTAACRSS